MTEARVPTLSRIKSTEALNYTSSHTRNNVCPRIPLHPHVMLCVCFCGLSASAPGLINILVSHEDIEAYRGEDLKGKARLCEHESV